MESQRLANQLAEADDIANCFRGLETFPCSHKIIFKIISALPTFTFKWVKGGR